MRNALNFDDLVWFASIQFCSYLSLSKQLWSVEKHTQTHTHRYIIYIHINICQNRCGFCDGLTQQPPQLVCFLQRIGFPALKSCCGVSLGLALRLHWAWHRNLSSRVKCQADHSNSAELCFKDAVCIWCVWDLWIQQMDMDVFLRVSSDNAI